MDVVTAHGTDRRPWGLMGAAFFALISFVALYTLDNIRTHLLRYFALITACMAVMMLAYRAWEIISGDDERRAIMLVIGAAMMFRIALIALPPSLSDDLYRYAWDGHLLTNGYNPYAYVPSDPALKSLRDESYPRIAYTDYHSIYPPVVEAGVGLAAWISNALFGGSMRATFAVWKIILLAAEGATLLILVRLLALWKMPARRLLLYAWHPLPIIEFAGQGHGDALMITALLFCIYAFARAKRGAGIVGYALAIASRAVPLIFAPLIARVAGWKHVALALMIALAFALPFSSSDMVHGVFDSTARMGRMFVFNAFGFWIVYGVLEFLHAWTIQPYITVFLAAVFVAGLCAISVRRGAMPPTELPRAMLAVCTLFALVVWNMHPWYFTWGLALMPLVVSWGWLWVTFASQFTYVHYTPRSDTTLLIAGIVEYGGFILLLVLQRRIDVARHGRRA